MLCHHQKLQLEETQAECQQVLEQLNASHLEALAMQEVQEDLDRTLQRVSHMEKTTSALELACAVSVSYFRCTHPVCFIKLSD